MVNCLYAKHNKYSEKSGEYVTVDDKITSPDHRSNTGNSGYDYLKEFPLLASLSDKQMARVHRHSNEIKLEEGHSIFIQDDPVNNFYLVKTGQIKLFRVSPKGEEKIINILTDGQIFAEALMFMHQAHYPVSATALSQSEIIGIDAKDFKIMLHDSVDTCFLMLSDMSTRLQGLIHEIDTLSLNTGTCRVASYILSSLPAGENIVILDVAKNVLAARLSIKPETLSRILKELSHQGILSVDGVKLTILDRQSLKSICIRK